jgi:hypothetical protein
MLAAVRMRTFGIFGKCSLKKLDILEDLDVWAVVASSLEVAFKMPFKPRPLGNAAVLGELAVLGDVAPSLT